MSSNGWREATIEAVAVEAHKAAKRHTAIPFHRRKPLRVLCERLEGDAEIFQIAVLEGDMEKICATLGELVYSAALVADHDHVLGEWEPKLEEHGEE